jgi:iron complex transport system ATP-binding protein
LIDVQSICCRYKEIDVISGVTFRIEGGEMVGILGPNGSGKTTLLLALAGAIVCRTGRVLIENKDIREQSARCIARQVACVPQRTEAGFPFKCLSVVLMGRYPHLDGWGSYSSRDVQIAIQAMNETGISRLADCYLSEISGGEAQVVTIARALAQQTTILLLDEATSSLDVARKIQIFDLLSQKNRGGMTLVCVMHDINLAALYCDRLIFIKNGRIVIDGKTSDVFNEENLSTIYDTDIKVSYIEEIGAHQAHFVPSRRNGLHDGSSDTSEYGRSD